MRPMIPAFAALALFISTHTALAQAPAPPAPAVAAPAVPAAKPVRRVHVTRLEQQFAKANTSHDGHLTLEQAKAARMRSVVTHFAEIDRGAKGYVTIEDLQTESARARAARLAAKAANKG